jgi:hypothetical protein
MTGAVPGSGLKLWESESQPLEDLQMVRCKVSCPPPSITEMQAARPSTPFGRGHRRTDQVPRGKSRRARRIRRDAWR